MDLTVAVREELGKGKAGKMRKNGGIPGVLYGEGKPNVHLTVNTQEFGRLVLKGGVGKLINLKIQKGKTTEQQQVLIKELQRHPIKGNILHIDFLRVAMDHPVTVKVPLSLANEERRTRDGAIIELLLHELEVSCLPADIPDRIIVHTANLTAGGRIHVKDLELPHGVKAVLAPEETVVQIVAPTVSAEAETTTEQAATEPEVIKEKKEEA